jgi:hypothetical protein
VQLAEIVSRAPKSLEGLKSIEGLGEAFCRDYGAAVLELVAAAPPASPRLGVNPSEAGEGNFSCGAVEPRREEA